MSWDTCFLSPWVHSGKRTAPIVSFSASLPLPLPLPSIWSMLLKLPNALSGDMSNARLPLPLSPPLAAAVPPAAVEPSSPASSPLPSRVREAVVDPNIASISVAPRGLVTRTAINTAEQTRSRHL
ncbi:hypothetical protein Vafri_10778 [Volvox africanus]|uniref:Uncharacterized protein n=1 Tax=Volvox africanus TaxID=51714 RepID=A0A8J4F115_9CHLO|nr:hypothetical protein Vafri_10778 [Volvox africanus]